MDRLWHVRWHDTIEIVTLHQTYNSSSTTSTTITSNNNPTTTPIPSTTNRVERQKVFAILQGHRFLWWRTTYDFDSGNEPLGHVTLQGHAGLATPSPLEIRELNKSILDLSRLLCIFGRGIVKQERITILLSSGSSKHELERLVEETVSEKQD